MPSPHNDIIFRDPSSLPETLRGGAVAIGNFDGVHRGHRAVLERTTAIAAGAGVPALALTFEPHPRSFFRPHEPVFRLTPSDLKAELLAKLGFDAVVEMTFNADLAAIGAEDFVADILVARLGVSHVVVGHDFHFGRKRAGTPQLLTELGGRHGFAVTVVPAAGTGETVFSSSRVREFLAEGRVEDAAGILGYEWRTRGAVRHGARRGRDLGFPTANIQLPANAELRHGVYAVRVSVDGVTHNGVANFGRRPQFDNGQPLLEVYIFDFAGDLYGKTADVSFVAFLREEARFDSVSALIEQMNEDARQARQRLSGPPREEAAGR